MPRSSVLGRPRSLDRVSSPARRFKAEPPKADFDLDVDCGRDSDARSRDAQRVIEEQRARRISRLATRERWSLLISAGSFLAVGDCPGRAISPPHATPGAIATILLIAVYALAFRLDFEIGTGSAVPTQLVLVPMLFVLPIGIVPLAVAGGVILGSLSEYAGGGLHLERVFMRLVNCWHAIGPVLVLGLAGESAPALDDWPLYLGALGAQFALDYGSAARPRVDGARRASEGAASRDGVGLHDRRWAGDDRPRGRLCEPSTRPTACSSPSRSSACSRSSRASGGSASTTSSSFATPTAAPRSSSATSSRPTTGTRASTAGTSSSSRSRSSDELGLDERARRDAEFVALLHDVGKLRVPNEIINKAGPLTRRRVGARRAAHGRGRAAAPPRRRPARPDRPDRPFLPRALRRDRLSGRARR